MAMAIHTSLTWRTHTHTHAPNVSKRNIHCLVTNSVAVGNEKVKLGKSNVEVSQLGIGAWSWGDKSYWNNGEWNERMVSDAKGALSKAIEIGLEFVDTAEVYGAKYVAGAENSETILGRFISELKPEEQSKVKVATKFAPLPWRFGRGSVVSALKGSLERLKLPRVDLYQIHWPGIWGNGAFLDGLCDAVEQGLVKAVGVSNYNEDRLIKAYEQLKKRGIILASNQVNYSLIYRKPEENGVKRACDELGISLIAYSPIAQGTLSGKYSPSKVPNGARGVVYNAEFLRKLTPTLDKLKQLGETYGKTPTQVALNWLVAQKNVIPIPGAKSASQANEFAGALGWSLTEDEVEELREIAKQSGSVVGNPVENF